MQTLYVAFDVDNTLIKDDKPNKWAVALLMSLAQCKNTKIIVWSGGGADYAREWGTRAELDGFVWAYSHKLNPDLPKIDIAFDDVEDFQLADKNVIVE